MNPFGHDLTIGHFVADFGWLSLALLMAGVWQVIGWAHALYDRADRASGRRLSRVWCRVVGHDPCRNNLFSGRYRICARCGYMPPHVLSPDAGTETP